MNQPNISKQFFVAFLVMITIYPLPFYLQADTIYLTNGRKVEGIITKEDSLKVYIDIGIGRSKIARGRILRVEKSSVEETGRLEREWQQKYFDSERFVPEGFQELSAKLSELSDIRSRALDIKGKLARLQMREKKLLKEIKKLRVAYIEGNELLKKIDYRTERAKYNSVYNRLNVYNADLNIRKTKLEQIQQALKIQNPHLFEYIEKLAEFEKNVDRFSYKKKKKRKLHKEEQIYLNSVKSKLKEYNSDFLENQLNIAFSPGKQVILNVRINDKATGRFLLDTGASSVTFSKAFAAKLGLDLAKAQKINATLADGKTVVAKAVILESVRVEKATEEEVMAVVLDNPPGKNVDGLLGMSFLGRFIIRIDADNNRILLKKFK